MTRRGPARACGRICGQPTRARSSRGVAAAAAVLLAALPLSSAACRGREGGAGGPFPAAPVVLISIDTLRSDHLPLYGYRAVETPAIDALGRDGIVFESAWSHVPLTLPSHLSILTGRLPGEHGVRDNIGYHFDPGKLDDLPMALGKAGYKTGGAVSAYVLRRETGVARGFDFYDSQIEVQLNEALGRSQRPGKETAAVALDWLRRVAGGPFFLFLHLYEPHAPYTPPEPFASRYKDNPYDGEIATADAVVGDVIAELERLGLYDRAVVILLSDHGEGLGEHGEREHGILLYRTTLQVPLLLKLPGSRLAGSRVGEAAQLIDVYPTVLSLLGLPVPAGLAGQPLLALLRPAAPSNPSSPSKTSREIYSETVYPRLHYGWSELSSLLRERFHYIHGPDPELYDLTADPGELRNSRASERRTAAALRDRVRAYERQLAAPAAEDQETVRKLTALGYAAGALQPAAGEILPDPKTRIGSLADLNRAMTLLYQRRYDEAIPVFRHALEVNPKLVDGWEHLGQALHQVGRRPEALQAFEKAMTLSGGMPHLALATGGLLLDMGRLDEAQKHAELALQVSPGPAQSLLAKVAFARRQPEAAEKAARAALAAEGLKVEPLLTLARVRVLQGKLGEALAFADQAQQELARNAADQDFPSIDFVRGDILGRLHRDGEAEQAFLHGIQHFPTDPRAYASLALLYASQEREAEAVATLRRMVEANESPVSYAEAVQTLRILGDPRGAAALLRQALGRFPQSTELRALAGASRPPGSAARP
ncbi:MAG TPA: sulfatase-like hydrolase/transferase [Thermoanaerobaculia bacterium]|nr:sulfatase-like hydrolase/transferase [Thermoanaerobaculia bacterium]